MTSTFGREWYDEKDPQVRFPARPAVDNIYGITLKSCKGRMIGLVEAVNGAADENYRTIPDFLRPELDAAQKSKR